MISSSKYLTRSEAARKLGVSRQRISFFVISGRIATEYVAGRRLILAAEFAEFCKIERRPGRNKKNSAQNFGVNFSGNGCNSSQLVTG
jgi:hypothetical protein